ncbi:hypothetical protein GH721_14000 [Kriegella sp. EG-1]|nr:hypothetical protein [Flavobacteriaceae bacterium EG-1]
MDKAILTMIDNIPEKTGGSIIRKRQFIFNKPASKTGVDLGFKLKDKPTTER